MQGGHSLIFENYVRTNIGFTLKLQRANYKTCTCNTTQVYIEHHDINELKVSTNLIVLEKF